MRLNDDGVKVNISFEKTDVIISSDMVTLSRIKDGQNGLRMLLKSLLVRKLRIKGGLRKILAVYRNRWVFKEIMKAKIT